MTYYVTESSCLLIAKPGHIYTVEAKSLTGAKIGASRKQLFHHSSVAIYDDEKMEHRVAFKNRFNLWVDTTHVTTQQLRWL